MDDWVIVDMKHSGTEERMTISLVIKKRNNKKKIMKRIVKILKFLFFVSVQYINLPSKK